MSGQERRKRLSRSHVQEVQRDVRTFEQELNRYVRHEIARAGEHEHAQRLAFRSPYRLAIHLLEAERLGLQRERVVPLLEHDQDERQVHERGRVVRVRPHPFGEARNQRRQVLTVKRHVDDASLADERRRPWGRSAVGRGRIRGHG